MPTLLEFPRAEYESRCRALQAAGAAAGFDLLLLTSPENVRYASGFRTTVWAIPGHVAVLALPTRSGAEPALVASQSLLPLAHATTWLERFVPFGGGYGQTVRPVTEAVVEHLREAGLASGRLAWELGPQQRLFLTGEQQAAIQSGLPAARFGNAMEAVWPVRQRKSPLEVEAIRTAAEITCSGLRAGFEALRPGVTEQAVWRAMVQAMAAAGAEAQVLAIVSQAKGLEVLDGPPADLEIPLGSTVRTDGGARYKGYQCDMQRMAVLGRASDEQRRWADTIRAANRAAIEALWPGQSLAGAVEAGNAVLRRAGLFERRSAASAGHGTGLTWQEPPTLREEVSLAAEPGWVLCVELAISDRPDWRLGSFSVEDLVAVGADGPQVLSGALSPELWESAA